MAKAKTPDDLRKRMAALHGTWIKRSAEFRRKAGEASKAGNQLGAEALIGASLHWSAAADELEREMRRK